MNHTSAELSDDADELEITPVALLTSTKSIFKIYFPFVWAFDSMIH